MSYMSETVLCEFRNIYERSIELFRTIDELYVETLFCEVPEHLREINWNVLEPIDELYV